MPHLHWKSTLRTSIVACGLALVASSAHAVTVSVVPSDTTVTLGSIFEVRVVTDAFPDLKAYELVYHYGAGLEYDGSRAGDVLTGSGQPYTVNDVPDVAAPADTAEVDCAQLLTSTSGPGVLIYYKFKATAVGVTPIDCLSVDFRNSHNDPTIPDCAGGTVHVTAPVPVERKTWGRMKAIYR
jgi:hypothetical protein